MEQALAERLSAFGVAWSLSAEAPAGRGPTRVDPSVFEAFATHLVVNGLRDMELDRNDVLSLLTGGKDDAKLDAIGLFIDREPILSEEDLNAALTGLSESTPIEFIFVQATLMEHLAQGKLEKSCTGIANFAAPEPALAENALVQHWRRLKNQLFRALSANGITRKPTCALYIVWPSSRAQLRPDHHGILDLRRRDIERLGLFDEVVFRLVDGRDLMALAERNESRNVIHLKFSELMAYPDDGHAFEAPVMSWGGRLAAVDLVTALEAPDGRLRRELFAENVRFDLGEPSGSVNEGIGQTLEGPGKGCFHILNNGLTLVAREVRQIASDVLECRDLKVINGCQTTYSLHRHRAALDPDVKVLAKIVATQNSQLVDQIIVTTNRQTHISPVEFLSRLAFVRRLQLHFDSLRDAHGERLLWFERLRSERSAWERSNGQRVIGIEDMIRAYVSVVLERPELPQSADWKAMRALVPEQIFNPDHVLEVYEIAALIAWRAREFMQATDYGDTYPAKNHLMLAMRLVADPPGLTPGPLPGPGRDRTGAAYVRLMREALLSDRRAGQIAAEAHGIVVAVAKALQREFNAKSFAKVDATQMVVDIAQRRTAAE